MAQTPPPFSPDLPPHHQVTVVDVIWARVLEFTYLFRGFRLAINPSKMIIALLAIIAIYCAGRVFDLAWGPKVYENEIETYQTSKSDQFLLYRDQHLADRERSTRDKLWSATIMVPKTSIPAEQMDYLVAHPRAAEAQLKKLYVDMFHQEVVSAAEDRQAAEAREKTQTDAERADRPPGYRSPAEREAKARQDAGETLMRNITEMKRDIGTGIFDSFMTYELKQADGLVRNTLSFIRVAPVHQDFDITSGPSAAENTVSGSLLSMEPERLWRSDTIAGCVANMTITGPSWLFSATAPMQYRATETGWYGTVKTYGYRGLYLLSLVMFAAFCLGVVAFSGGSICRLSALEFAGHDKPSPARVGKFVLQRFWDLVRAPLMPFAILLFLGLLISLVGLAGAIPWIGEIMVGALFILVLVAAFVAMLVLLGIIGGFNLLYPTIAVEGSDSFDAMSRGFAYVYARPWRLGFYTIVSLIYGVATYLFVCFAVYLIMAITHLFLGAGMGIGGLHQGVYSGLPKLETLWPVPHMQALGPKTNWWAMNWSETIGAMFLHFWLYLLISCVGAYVISYYHSANTIIYFLLRRAVDGQSLTEVYDSETPAILIAPPAEPAPIVGEVPSELPPPATGES